MSEETGAVRRLALTAVRPRLNQQVLYALYLSLVNLAGAGLLLWGLFSFPHYINKDVFLLLCGLAAVSALVTSSVAALGIPPPGSILPFDEHHTWNFVPEWYPYGYAK
ncbi:MAG TPA: hypothetical protein PKE45_15885 [Caldilineaceae bacterium]|nr:hypothetical protein [Caldilineaceae bacterium]